MKKHSRIWVGAAFCIALFSTGLCSAADSKSEPINLKAECVGHYQLDLPDRIEIATRFPPSMHSHRDEDRLDPFRFSDGVRAYFSHGFNVTDKMSEDEFSALTSQIIQGREKVRQSMPKEAAGDYHQYDLGVPQSFAWRSQVGIVVALYRGGRVFYQGFTGDLGSKDYPAEFEKQVALDRQYAASFQLREPFVIPATAGQCIPYGFVPDDGKAPRDIAVTVRPVDHPEVLITLEEKSIIGPDPRLPNMGSLAFMLQYDYGPASPKMKQLDQHKQQIAGRAGEMVFVRLYRKTGQEDYVYLASVFGSSKAPTDTPTITLRIERNSALTKNTPISEKDFKKLAERIAASIQRRPVTQP